MLLIQHESVYLILLFNTLKGESFCVSAWSSLKLYVFWHCFVTEVFVAETAKRTE